MKAASEGIIGKFEGALLGAALGDAMGWPHEDRARRSSYSGEARSVFESWTKRSGGRFQPHEEHIEAGSYSDDTQLLIAVARARLKVPNWWHYLAQVEFPFWTLYHRGAGGASLRAARLLQKNVLPWEANTVGRAKYFEAGGNGAAMRVAAHSLLGLSDKTFKRVATNVIADSVLTHGHPVALVGALAYSYALWIAVRKKGTLEYGELIEEVRSSYRDWAALPSLSEFWPSWSIHSATDQYQSRWAQAVADIKAKLDIAADGLSNGALDFDEETVRAIGAYDKKTNGAGTVAAVAAIFLASKYAISPMEGVVRAALAKGTDTDTIASMTGALLGAINGTNWLLTAVKGLQDREFLSDLAKALLDGRVGILKSEAQIDKRLGKLLRQLESGEKSLSLPIGSRARVVGDGGVATKSLKLHVDSWRVEDENRQTFFFKVLRKIDQADLASHISQKNFDLDSSAMVAGKLAGISLLTSDINASRHFYSVLLGLSVTRDSGDLVGLGSNLVLRQTNAAPMTGEGTIVYVDVSDIRACWSNLRRIPYAAASEMRTGHQRSSFTCLDPDGRTVEVFHS